jgi:hypothetical protein
MTTIPVIQPSFAAGELSPFLYGRVDLAKFHIGCRTLLNWLVHAHGGASNRPGTRFIDEVDDSTVRHRLIPFSFRTLPAGQTYILVFGHLTMQVAMFDGIAWGFVETSPGVRFTLATPYAAADLALLKYVQSADTMTLTHPAYAVRRLTRSGHARWLLQPITFQPSTPTPAGLAASALGSAAVVQVTAINDATGEESLPSAGVGATSATAGSWSWSPVPGCTNYNVYKLSGSIYGWVAQVQAASFTDNGFTADVGNTPPGSRNPFGTATLTGIAITAGGTGYNAPAGAVIDAGRIVTSVSFGLSGGVITSASLASTTQTCSANAYVQVADGGGSGAALLPQWSDPDPDTGQRTLTGVAVSSGGASYTAHATVAVTYLGVPQPQVTLTPTVASGVITAVAIGAGELVVGGDYSLYLIAASDTTGHGASFSLTIGADDGGTQNPGCSAYFLQRQAYGDTTALPTTLWFTCVGAYNNMNVSSPTRDSDAITRTLTGRHVDEIRHLVPVGQSMLIMTSGAEWRCWAGPASSALTPAACFTLPQTFHGTSHVPPIVAGNDVLFVQEKGSRVRALRFDAIQDQYQSFDMSILSSHLLYDFAGTHQIVEWAFAQEPFQIIWGVRDDGLLLGFTYMREQDVYAWHRHTTDGSVESVAAITERDGFGGYEDAVYLIVNRTIGGQTKRYLERMMPRTFPTIADAWFVDCGLNYDGAPVSTFSGLDHLEGKTVAILGDGNVVPSQVVSGGQIVLDGRYSKVVAGLPYTCDLETLNLEMQAGGPTVQGQMKKIAQVTVRVKESRGLLVGINTQKVDGTSTVFAAEVKQQWKDALGTALPAYTGDWQVTIPSEWNRDGRVFVRQGYPLPATILDLIPEVTPGD